MTDHIEPALTLDDWRRIPGIAELIRSTFDATDGELALSLANDRESGDITFDRSPHGVVTLIAALNAALPDDDPRKLRREWVRFLRDAATDAEVSDTRGSDAYEFRAIADALESYLPPE